MNEHEATSTQPTPSADDQAWLDATPRGESRSVVYRVGEVRKEFIVDRRTTTVVPRDPTQGPEIELKYIPPAKPTCDEPLCSDGYIERDDIFGILRSERCPSCARRRPNERTAEQEQGQR